MEIRVDDLRGVAIAALLQVHLDAMHAHSPPESVHALDMEALRHPSITFWTAWDGEALMGCGALTQLSKHHGELKSMRTAAGHARKGVARALLRHIEAAARANGMERMSLETGTNAPFFPAHQLYASEGFVECGPFANYVLDPFSLFMTKPLFSVSTARLPHNAAIFQNT
jgi:putative acetyltransferase